MNGMVFRLVKTRGENQIDTEKTRMKVDEIYRYRGLTDPNVYKDANTLKLLSNYRAVHLHLAGAYLKERKTDEARQVIRSCGDRIPMDWRSYYAAAQLFAGVNDKEGAAEFIGKTEESAFTEDEEAQIYIAYFYYTRMKDFDKAGSMLRILIDRGTADPTVYRMLASLLETSGNYSEAMSTLKEFADRHPERIEFQQMIQRLKDRIEKTSGDSGGNSNGG
jgi:predicted Zn-dependent protease